jgi:two-component system, OmpR family, catabolic regulation response regulator CreB
MNNILMVEDELAIADAVLYALRSEGFNATHVLRGELALQAVHEHRFDLIVLDVGLPDISGFDVCRRIRQQSNTPIIFLTARAEEVDRIVGLEIGGDDYLAKPFSPRELVARVRAVLRRTQISSPSVSAHTELFKHDRDGKRVIFFGHSLDLTRYEYELLAKLLSRPGAVFSRAQLMDSVWQDALDTSDRTVDTHIKTLRAKLREFDEGEYLHTHRGMGYSISINKEAAN